MISKNGDCQMNRAIFLDRDGVIVKDNGYVHKIEDLYIIDGAVEAIKNLNSAGFLVIVISNQAGIARGYFREEDAEKFNNEIIKRLKQLGAYINAVYFCPHHPTEGKIKKYSIVCDCRKPAPGMILKAAKDHKIDLRYSWMIGDRNSDIEAGKNAGCNTLMIGKDTKNIKQAAEIILNGNKLK